MLVFADPALSLRLALIAALLVAGSSSRATAATVCGPPVPGRTVGPGCLACWIPPTTHVDGSPIQLPLGFALYVYTTPPPIIGQTPPTLTSSLFDGVRGVCPALTPGQAYQLGVTAIEGTAESALSAPFPFVFDRPRQITGAGIR